ncbi:autotransporter outer membrane beta-barrel domain-containing protein [Bartonella florencae]|uniref:autotransporter family protein n=1 Tax=Bartonella florencae TaxID=928210 RepID=UPI00031EADBF|nr:autotransporter outer membrane beta-barrel domain-containing protein [Bartonella florencae]
MIRVSKNYLYSCVFTTAVFSFSLNITVEAYSNSPLSLLCNESKLPYKCSDGVEHTISNKIYKFVKSSKERKEQDNFFTSSAVIVAQEANTIIQANRLQISGVDDVEDTYGVVASEGGKVVLNDSIIQGLSTGFRADRGIIEVNRGTVEATQRGVHAEMRGASVLLTNAKIRVKGQEVNKGVALFSGIDAVIKMRGGAIDVTNAAALYVGIRGSATLEGVSISAKDKQIDKEDDIVSAVLNVKQHGSVYVKNSNVLAADIHGLWMGIDADAQLSMGGEENILISRVNIEGSKITVTGNQHGIYFDMDKGSSASQQRFVFLKNTVFDVPDGTAIHSYKSSGYIGVTEGTKIWGNLLFTAEKNASLAILADSAYLIGGSRVADDSLAELYLTRGSTWVLTKRKGGDSQNLSRVISSVSFVKLSDSSIIFEAPTLQEYQTLYVGKGGEEVYNAQENAHIYFNTHLNVDGSLNNQKSDRLLVHGNVTGKTTVHVQFITANQGEAVGSENSKNISLIQVSGKAAEDSFQLSSPYIALEGLPYQYYLRAYGPGSSLGNAKASQRLVKGDGDFWDFRLESKYIQAVPDISHLPSSELRVRDVVPQIPTYLLLPNALFHAGLMDINSQNKQLKTMRSASDRPFKINGTPMLAVHGYGGSYHYVSNLSPLEYGYGGALDYNALEAGLLLSTFERAFNTTSFGVMGTYGKVSLRPRDVEQSQKSIFHKQSITAYGSMEHESGFYVDGLLSYGLFKGDVLTFARGKTATLKGNPLNVSFFAGKAFNTGYEGLVFDPQIQFIYQHLQFHKARDTDGFEIDMGKLDQWMMRIGGRLSKTFAEFEKDRVISFYGKMHFSHSFGEKQFVHFKDAFHLGGFGSSLEAGLGINSQLSSKITLHGDLNYQHKFTKAGFTGIRFSGGLHYRF